MRQCQNGNCPRSAVLEVMEIGQRDRVALCALHADIWAAGWLVRGTLGVLQDAENAAEHAGDTLANGVGADNGAHHRM